MDCIFCNIIKGDIPCNKIYEDELIMAFYDIDPRAPIHFLVIPKVHLFCVSEIDSSNSNIIAHIFEKIVMIAGKLELSNGYRVVTNCGEDAYQTVPHLHFHVLAGHKLSASFS